MSTAAAPKLTRIAGHWHFALGATAYRLAQKGRDWVATTAADHGTPLAAGGSRRAVVAQVVAEHDTPIPGPTVSRRLGNDGGQVLTVTVEGWSGVDLVRRGEYWTLECGKCSGTGYLAHYANIHDGVCFGCDGDGIVGALWSEEEAKAAMVREAVERKRADERFALEALRQAANWTAYAEAEPELAAWMLAARNVSEFAASLRLAVCKGTKLSDRQVTAARRAAEDYARREAEKAEREAAKKAKAAVSRPAGAVDERVEVTGTVTLARSFRQEGRYGRSVTKVVLLAETADGVTVKVFSTSEAAFDAEVGDTVKVAGTVKRTERGDAGETVTVLGRPRLTLVS